MSIRATDYALTVAPEAGTPGARLILFALAGRANSKCGCTFGGGWLAEVSGLSTRSVRRHLDALESAGIVALAARSGRAPVVRFPLQGFIHNPGHQCPGCRAWNRVLADTSVPESGKESGSETARHGPVDDADLSVVHVREIWKRSRDQARQESAS